MVGNKHTNISFDEVFNYFLNLDDRKGVNAGKWLIEQYKCWL